MARAKVRRSYLSLNVSQSLLRLLAVRMVVHFLHCGFFLFVIILVHFRLDTCMAEYAESQRSEMTPNRSTKESDAEAQGVSYRGKIEVQRRPLSS